MRIVDCLEVVDVQHQAAQRRAVLAGAAQHGLEVFMERAPVQAAGHRVARGKSHQGLVLPLDLILGSRQLAHRQQQPVVGTVQLGGVVEGGDAAAHMAAYVGDRCAIDDHLACVGRARRELQSVAGVGGVLAHGACPGVAGSIVGQAR